MALFSKELKDRLKQANSLSEVRSILHEHRHDPSMAEPVWTEIEHFRQEVSPEELEAVTGGADRDYLKEGCAATVEAGSKCWTNDACEIWSVTYDNCPTKLKCPDCGGMLCLWDNKWDSLTYCPRYNCANCGGFYQTDPHDKKKYKKIR